MIKVFTTGTFDLIHYGHINLLKKAKELGDYLVVGVNANPEGKSPINTVEMRKLMLESIRYVDEVIILHSQEDKFNYLKENQVDFFAIGSDYIGYSDIKDIEKLVKPNTKLIVTTHASNVCGTLIDIKSISEIATKHNILYLIDASQTVGVYNIDLKDIKADMLAAPGHKGLLGPQGIGILYIREGLNINLLKVTYVYAHIQNWCN